MDSATLYGLVFQLAILLFSVVVHEVSHGMAANALGDPTAKDQGRLTLNPIAHLSFFGMVVLPLMTYLAWQVPIAAAKPVPYDPRNLRNRRWGSAFVAAAGPLSNLVIAGLLAAIVRAGGAYGFMPALAPAFDLLKIAVFINIWLMLVNLIPIPPIDGSRIIAALAPPALWQQLYWEEFKAFFVRYWPVWLVIFVVFGGRLLVAIAGFIAPLAESMYSLLLG